MGRADAILTAVQHIHDVALTLDGWTRALASIAAAVGSGRACLLVQDAESGAAEFIAGFEMAPQHLTDYAAAANSRVLPAWMQDLYRLPAGVVRQSSAIVSDQEFVRSAFYNEAVRPMGDFYGIVIAPVRSPRRRVYFAAGRSLGREDYDPNDVAVLQTLVPHLATALHVGWRVAAAELQSAIACAAVDQLKTCVILVDAAARILFASPAAEAILAGNDGLGTSREGICTGDHGTTRILRRLIANCAGITLADGGPGGALEVGHGGTSLRVIVAPFRADALQVDTRWLGISRPAAIFIVSNPEHERCTRTDELRRRFGLTPAEAAVALEIVRGDGREATAARLGIGATTVRSHLSQIFEKTGVRRQAELVRLLLQGHRKGES